jgi:hypothetical protein
LKIYRAWETFLIGIIVVADNQLGAKVPQALR